MSKDYNARAKSAIDAIHKVGRVSKLYGTAGEVVVKLYDALTAREFIAKTQKGEPLWIEIDSIATPFFIADARNQGVAAVVATFEQIDSEQRAQMIIGHEVYLESVKRVRDRATDWAEIEGYNFEDVTSGVMGVIKEVIDNSLNPLMYVDTEAYGEVYVPLSEDLVVGFDAKERLISMELVENFFEHIS